MTALFVRLAANFVDILVTYGIIEETRKRLYEYGFELLLSSVAGIAALFFLSVLVGKPTAWIPYLLGFIPFRLTGGGYHAKSHSSCITLFSVAYLVSMLIDNEINKVSCYGMMINFWIIVLYLTVAPVQATNKPVPVRMRKKHRRFGISIAVLNMFLGILEVSHLFRIEAPLMYYIGNTFAGISILVGFITNKRREGKT